MAKNHYRITIEKINSNQEQEAKSLSFDFDDQEDIFDKVAKINQVIDLDGNQATRLAVGIRLLGPVMMLNRKHPLFVDFMPHFGNFMQNLKATVKSKLS